MNTLKNGKANFTLRLAVFLVIVVLSGLPFWISTYTQYLNNLWISGVSTLICAIAAVVILLKTTYKKIHIILYALVAHQLALIVKIVLDCLADSTNHNLAPFEMIMLFGFDFAVVGIVVACMPAKKAVVLS